LTVAAVVFLVVYAWQVLGELQGPASDAADVILTITWVMFAIDYVARLVLAQRRWSWFGRHLLDLAIVALPILRPLRLVRLVVLLAIFQRVAGRTPAGSGRCLHRRVHHPVDLRDRSSRRRTRRCRGRCPHSPSCRRRRGRMPYHAMRGVSSNEALVWSYPALIRRKIVSREKSDALSSVGFFMSIVRISRTRE